MAMATANLQSEMAYGQRPRASETGGRAAALVMNTGLRGQPLEVDNRLLIQPHRDRQLQPAGIRIPPVLHSGKVVAVVCLALLASWRFTSPSKSGSVVPQRCRRLCVSFRAGAPRRHCCTRPLPKSSALRSSSSSPYLPQAPPNPVDAASRSGRRDGAAPSTLRPRGAAPSWPSR
jgi:hypothetical protein